MGYDLHITRAEDWSDPEGPPITADEWHAYVAADPELTLDPDFGPHGVLWVGPGATQEDGLYWFEPGQISTTYPDRPLVAKMLQIAEHLGARVQGDDGEDLADLAQADALYFGPTVRDSFADDDRRSLVVLLALAFAGGYADAGSYLLVGSFTGHLTGNTVLTMVHLAAGEFGKAGACLLAVAAFLAGTALGARRHGGAVKDGAGLARLQGPLLVETTFFGAAIVATRLGPAAGGHLAAVGCLALALGWQNGAFQRLGALGVHTTYVTGVSTSLVAAAMGGTPDRPRRDRLAALVSYFAAGALAGGLLVGRAGADALVLLVAPVLVALRATLPVGR